MKKTTTTAEFNFLKLIEQLKKENKNLTNNELIEVLNEIKPICNNPRLIDIMIIAAKSLYNTKVENKKTLTNREMEILTYIGSGLQNKNIAVQLNLSKSTIETHRKNIRKKLKLKSNDNLFIYALLFKLQDDAF